MVSIAVLTYTIHGDINGLEFISVLYEDAKVMIPLEVRTTNKSGDRKSFKSLKFDISSWATWIADLESNIGSWSSIGACETNMPMIRTLSNDRMAIDIIWSISLLRYVWRYR